jgi:hypothetical protein
MNINLGIGVDITPQEIVNGLRALSSYINRDKDATCLALIIINETIGQWYKEINSFVIDQMAKNLVNKGQRMTLDDVRNAFTLQFDTDIQDTATSSLEFLEDVKARYNSGELRNLINKLDIAKITKIQDLIAGSNLESISADLQAVNVSLDEEKNIRLGFKYLARNDNNVYNYSEIASGLVYDGDLKKVEKLQLWLRSLEKIKDMIRQSVSSQLSSLQCQQQRIDILRKQIFRK